MRNIQRTSQEFVYHLESRIVAKEGKFKLRPTLKIELKLEGIKEI